MHGIFSCNFCDFTETAEERLTEHLRAMHPERPGSKMCKKCHRYVKVRPTPVWGSYVTEAGSLCQGLATQAKLTRVNSAFKCMVLTPCC